MDSVRGVLRALLSLLPCGLHFVCVCVCFFFWQQTVLRSTSEFRIPNVSGFRILYQSRFQIPNFKISWIPDSRFCYMAAGHNATIIASRGNRGKFGDTTGGTALTKKMWMVGWVRCPGHLRNQRPRHAPINIL